MLLVYIERMKFLSVGGSTRRVVKGLVVSDYRDIDYFPPSDIKDLYTAMRKCLEGQAIFYQL